ncbi:DUF6912 family protein [Nocardia iowensis]|uniref:Uncharacterized protein n=1 Tax=Nocardia iowensis TaxID=204891 RepID=A0ABX8S245_NOCIO|nr:hypothetical protein [Nocardia iowensis]QXN95973.1 hypothetical protein KV110_34055 [Nocardia iowensis]
MRVYIPATVPMLRELVANRELRPVGGTAFAVTPALREAYASGDEEELAEVAMGEAARASLRLLAAERDESDESAEPTDDAEPVATGGPVYRRAVIAADVTGAKLRPDLDDAVVRLAGPVTYNQIGCVHVDLAEAEPEVAKAVDVVDAADLGDTDAEFVLGDAEDHQLAWYAAQELPFLLELL